MGRYLSGILAIAAAAGVYQYNLTNADSQVFLFGINLIVGDDPAAQGDASWKALLAIGVLWLGWDVMTALRQRASVSKESDE